MGGVFREFLQLFGKHSTALRQTLKVFQDPDLNICIKKIMIWHVNYLRKLPQRHMTFDSWKDFLCKYELFYIWKIIRHKSQVKSNKSSSSQQIILKLNKINISIYINLKRTFKRLGWAYNYLFRKNTTNATVFLSMYFLYKIKSLSS